MKPHHYYDPCWMQNFYFFVGWKHERFCSYMKKNYNMSMGDGEFYRGKTSVLKRGDQTIILVWTRHLPTTPNNMSDLAHECLHAVTECLCTRGVKYGIESDEAHAYLLGVLVREAMK